MRAPYSSSQIASQITIIITALDGTECQIAGLSLVDANGDPFVNESNETIIGVNDRELPNDADTCWDFTASGNLIDYPFERTILSCTDTVIKDGLLDFSVAASFFQNAGKCC